MSRQRTAATVAVETAAAIVPAYNEAQNIERTVRSLQKVAALDDIVVVDGYSEDGTARRAERAGARVVQQHTQMYPGKGIALETGLAETDADAVVCFDADLINVQPDMPARLLAPIMAGRCDHTIGSYDRAGGRVTELTVRPLLNLLFPEVTFRQPLAGEYAFRRDAVKDLQLEPGWGLESGLVIDVVMQGLRSEEVDLGYKDHPMKSLADLRPMAREAAATILRKAVEYGRLQTPAHAAWEAMGGAPGASGTPAAPGAPAANGSPQALADELRRR